MISHQTHLCNAPQLFHSHLHLCLGTLPSEFPFFSFSSFFFFETRSCSWAIRVKLRLKKKKKKKGRCVLARRGGLRLFSWHFERPRWADHLRSVVGDQPGQHGEMPSLLKIQNEPAVVAHACNPSYLGG
uniref:Uncharacterized protein n=1 Tax=Macaca fascicularis TaxID=9541 RepID=A0A7N9CAM8_MACFA